MGGLVGGGSFITGATLSSLKPKYPYTFTLAIAVTYWPKIVHPKRQHLFKVRRKTPELSRQNIAKGEKKKQHKPQQNICYNLLHIKP